MVGKGNYDSDMIDRYNFSRLNRTSLQPQEHARLFQGKEFALTKKEKNSLFQQVVQVGHLHHDQFNGADYVRPVGVYNVMCQGCKGSTTASTTRKCVFKTMSAMLAEWVAKLVGQGDIEQIEYFKTMTVN